MDPTRVSTEVSDFNEFTPAASTLHIILLQILNDKYTSSLRPTLRKPIVQVLRVFEGNRKCSRIMKTNENEKIQRTSLIQKAVSLQYNGNQEVYVQPRSVLHTLKCYTRSYSIDCEYIKRVTESRISNANQICNAL